MWCICRPACGCQKMWGPHKRYPGGPHLMQGMDHTHLERAAAGCYILRPASFGIWEKITAFFDGAIKQMGVQNAYFPLFVTEDSLNTEKDHVEGFAAEVRGQNSHAVKGSYVV